MKKLFLLLTIIFTAAFASPQSLPEGFVFLTDVDPTIIESPRYQGSENFLGRKVAGYNPGDRMICTAKAAEQLKRAQAYFQQKGYRIVVYDAYRPQIAVDDFGLWGKEPKDVATKKYYYPTLPKTALFEQEYVGGERSFHTLGNTFDLTLIPLAQSLHPIHPQKRRLKNGDVIYWLDDGTLDMGSSFDLFHEASHHGNTWVSKEAQKNRLLLKEVMEASGFEAVPNEWWHYTLVAG